MDRMITMSQKKLKHAHVLDRLVKDSTYTNAEAAKDMGLSERQVIRLKGEYKKNGIDALAHKNIGRSPVHALDAAIIPQFIKASVKSGRDWFRIP